MTEINLPEKASKLTFKERDYNLRESVSRSLLWVFVVNNITVLLAVFTIYFTQGDKLIVTEGVVMALIGATTVQVGAAILLMARHVYRASAENDGPAQ